MAVGCFFLPEKGAPRGDIASFFPGAQIITPSNPPGDLHQCWENFEKVWSWRRKLLDEGWIEIAASATDELDGTDPTDDGPEVPTPAVACWALKRDSPVFDDFGALAGWKPES